MLQTRWSPQVRCCDSSTRFRRAAAPHPKQRRKAGDAIRQAQPGFAENVINSLERAEALLSDITVTAPAIMIHAATVLLHDSLPAVWAALRL